jgi:hypothetical protein
VAPRDPERPKTSDLPDVDVLDAVYSGYFPFDVFCPKWPKNLIASKLHKLVTRGLLAHYEKRYSVTPQGKAILEGE